MSNNISLIPSGPLRQFSLSLWSIVKYLYEVIQCCKTWLILSMRTWSRTRVRRVCMEYISYAFFRGWGWGWRVWGWGVGGGGWGVEGRAYFADIQTRKLEPLPRNEGQNLQRATARVADHAFPGDVSRHSRSTPHPPPPLLPALLPSHLTYHHPTSHNHYLHSVSRHYVTIHAFGRTRESHAHCRFPGRRY